MRKSTSIKLILLSVLSISATGCEQQTPPMSRNLPPYELKHTNSFDSDEHDKRTGGSFFAYEYLGEFYSDATAFAGRPTITPEPIKFAKSSVVRGGFGGRAAFHGVSASS